MSVTNPIRIENKKLAFEQTLHSKWQIQHTPVWGLNNSKAKKYHRKLYYQLQYVSGNNCDKLSIREVRHSPIHPYLRRDASLSFKLLRHGTLNLHWPDISKERLLWEMQWIRQLDNSLSCLFWEESYSVSLWPLIHKSVHGTHILVVLPASVYARNYSGHCLTDTTHATILYKKRGVNWIPLLT